MGTCFINQKVLCVPKMTQQLVAQLVFPPAKVQAILNIATGVIVLKSRSDYYVTPLLKTFRWFSMCIMVKAQIFKMTKASLSLFPSCTLPLWHHLLLLSLLVHFSPTTPIPLIFLEHARHISALTPLFPLPGMLFPQTSVWIIITFKPWFKRLLYNDDYLKLQCQ